eukprot:scaffold18511_cov63-Phaeocystis_antarctica.AAC.6
MTYILKQRSMRTREPSERDRCVFYAAFSDSGLTRLKLGLPMPPGDSALTSGSTRRDGGGERRQLGESASDSIARGSSAISRGGGSEARFPPTGRRSSNEIQGFDPPLPRGDPLGLEAWVAVAPIAPSRPGTMTPSRPPRWPGGPPARPPMPPSRRPRAAAAPAARRAPAKRAGRSSAAAACRWDRWEHLASGGGETSARTGTGVTRARRAGAMSRARTVGASEGAGPWTGRRARGQDAESDGRGACPLGRGDGRARGWEAPRGQAAAAMPAAGGAATPARSSPWEGGAPRAASGEVRAGRDLAATGHATCSPRSTWPVDR